jgi:hypothetical protein
VNTIMKNKTGRPLISDKAKNVLVGARIAPEEEARIEQEAAVAGLSKSEWVRRKLLGPQSQVSRADLRKLLSPARILTLDGQEISKGAVRLRTTPSRGAFWPDQLPSQPLGTQPGQRFVVEIGRHRFDTTDWEPCGAEIEVSSDGMCPLGPHFHFLCPLQ